MVTGLSDDNSSDESVENLQTTSLDENDVEQICEAIFTLIPEVSRLKELFLCWSLLDAKGRAEVDAQVCKWTSPERVQLYRPLKEALLRWELVQDTQGAPGCEPGSVTFMCDPQLEEEVINVICALEGLLDEIHHSNSWKEIPGSSLSKTVPLHGLPDGQASKFSTLFRTEQQRAEAPVHLVHRAHSAHTTGCATALSSNDISGYETD